MHYWLDGCPLSFTRTLSHPSFPSFFCRRPELIDEHARSFCLKFSRVLGIYGFHELIYWVSLLGVAGWFLPDE
jgi:hypothetical protein